MIQRIQSLYLLLVAVLHIIALFLPVAAFIDAAGAEAEFTNFGIAVEGLANPHSCWGMGALLILAAVDSLCTIFLYRNRMLQIRFTVFSMLMVVGYYVVFALFSYKYCNILTDMSFALRFAACLPFVALVLDWLAIRAIGKDEFLVRAADRLR